MATPTAANSAVQLIKAPETEWGVPPTTVPGDYEFQRFSSINFSLNRAELEDDSITAARGITSVRYGNYDASGTLSGSLAFENFNDLIASACMNDWVDNTTYDSIVSDGIVEKSYTWQINHTDVNVREVWTGMQVGVMNISSPVDGLSTVSFDMSGSTQEYIGTANVDATPTEQTVFQAMTHCNGVINYDGAPVTVITGIELTLDNTLETQHAWGNCAARDVTAGKSRVSGTLTALYANDVFQNNSLDETVVSLDFTLVDPDGNSIKFNIPSVKLGSTDAPVDGEGATVITVPFRGIYDSGIGGTLEVVSTPV